MGTGALTRECIRVPERVSGIRTIAECLEAASEQLYLLHGETEPSVRAFAEPVWDKHDMLKNIYRLPTSLFKNPDYSGLLSDNMRGPKNDPRVIQISEETSILLLCTGLSTTSRWHGWPLTILRT